MHNRSHEQAQIGEKARTEKGEQAIHWRRGKGEIRNAPLANYLARHQHYEKEGTQEQKGHCKRHAIIVAPVEQ